MFWAYLLLACCVVAFAAPTCNQDCSPIVGDQLFALLGNNQTRSQSPWVIQPNNTPYISFFDEFFLASEIPQGAYYVNITTRAVVLLSQNITLPTLPASKSLILTMNVISEPRHANGIRSDQAPFVILMDNTPIHVGAPEFRNRISVDISSFSGAHTLGFSVVSHSSTNYFMYYIDGIDISVVWNTPIASDMYVSTTGNDVTGDGTQGNPFCSVAAALSAVASGHTIYVEGGLYCNPKDHNLQTTKATSIIGYQNATNSWPLVDLNYRWTYISARSSTNFVLSFFSFTRSYTLPIALRGVANATFSNVTIENSYYPLGDKDIALSSSGLLLFDCPKVSISNFVARNFSLYAIAAVRSQVTVNNMWVTDAAAVTVQNGAVSITGGNIVYSYRGPTCLQTFFSTLTISDMTMKHCQVSSTNSELTLQHIHVDDQGSAVGLAGSVFTLFESNVTIEYATYENIVGQFDFISVNDKNTVVNIAHSKFINMTAYEGFVVAFGVLNIFNSSIIKSNVVLSFLGVAYNNGTLTLDSTTISEVSNTFPLFVVNQATMVIINSTLERVFIDDAVHFSVNDATIQFLDSNFTNCEGVALFQTTNSRVTVSRSSFTNNTVFFSSFYTQRSQIYMDNTSFTSNFGNYSAALYVVNSTSAINGGTFKDNTGGTGLIYQILSDVTITNAELTNNTGILEGSCFSVHGKMAIVNSSIDGNRAAYGGVAYITNHRALNDRFVNSSLSFSSSYIGNNQADVAGSVLFSLSDNNGFIDIDSEFVNNTSPVGYDAATLATGFVLSRQPDSEFVSGESILPPFIVELKDAYNQTTHQNVTVYVKVGDRNIASASAVEGVANFGPVPLYGTIGTNTTYTFYTSNITIPPQKFPATVAPCTPGYIPTSGDICASCPAKTYGYDGKNCVQCPNNAYCLGGASVVTLSGYWYNNDITPRVLYKCPGKSCAENNTCNANHMGIVCAECVKGYYNWGNGCQECDKVSGPIIVIGLIIAIALVIWFQREVSDTGLITVVSYFIQTLMILADGVNFGFLNFLNFQIGDNKGAGSVTKYNLCPGPFDFYDRYYFTYISPLILLVILVLSVAVEQLLHLIRILKSIPDRGRQNGALVNLVLFVYSPITNNVFGMFFCTTISETLLLVTNNAIRCSGYEYNKARAVAIAFLIVVLLIPMVLFILLFLKRNKLDKESNKRVWGALYMQFKPQYYYWNVIILLRRFVIIILALLSAEQETRALLLVIATLITMVLQLTFMPFRTKMDNFLESVSLVGLFVFACFLDNGNQDTFQWVVLAVGVIFGVCLLFSVIVLITQKISEKLGKTEPQFTRVFSQDKLGASSSGTEMSGL